MRRALNSLLPAALATAALANPPEAPEAIFAIHCAACHAPDYAGAGPSLVEISGVYRDDPAGFVAWSMNPGRKRPESVEMPSMAHLGPDTLAALHGYVVAAAAGKSERKPPAASAAISREIRRPHVQRIFLPDASPAAIAVAMPGDLSYCFDAATCELRYLWRGGFLDGEAHWKGNGSALAAIDGEIVHRVTGGFPLTVVSTTTTTTTTAAPRFLGFRLRDGLPEFIHTRDGVRFTELIRPLEDGSGITREFTTDGRHPLVIREVEGATLTSSTGNLNLSAVESTSFTLTLRWK